MVGAALVLLGCSGFARHLHREIGENALGGAVRDYPAHTGLHCVPGAVSRVHMGTYGRGIVLNQVPVRVGKFIQKTQLKYISSVGKGCHIAGKLDIGVGMGALSHGGTLRVLR